MMRNETYAMHASSKILISLSSFGAAEVRRHGQLWFARLAHAAGADGVEVRGELLADAAAELPAIAGAARELALDVVYSSPQGLWQADGTLDADALDAALHSARLLGAARVKMSIGGFCARAPAFDALQRRLVHEGIELLIENDQTASAGAVDALREFFAAAADGGLRPGMTFDMGNWHWTGECPLQAAQAFAPQVSYVHCKGVQRQPQRWVAVPLADSTAPWRAILRAMPAGVPWAIEYPVVGDDLLALTRREIAALRGMSADFGASRHQERAR
jgi:sugar phosphate isomerase/epimerase